MPYSFSEAEVINIIDETASVKRFFLSIHSNEPFVFLAGQFIMLDLPIESKITTRSYSIANAPDGTNTIELLIVFKPNGLASEYLFNKISIGSTLKVSKAVGRFVLPEIIDKDIYFICTGTGIAPFRSMISDIINRRKPHRNLVLIFGTRYKSDLLYREEFLKLGDALPGFEFVPVLSRETHSDWNGSTGYVHDVYLERVSQKPDAYFYLCGWAEMLKEARINLESLGYEKSRIYFEAYD